MKKIVVAFIVVFMLAAIMVGCEKAEELKDLKEPTIYLDGKNISNNRVTPFVSKANIFIAFDKATLNQDALNKISFKTDNVNLIKKQILGNSINIILSSWNDQPISIVIDSGLTDANGRSLKEDIVVNLQKVTKTKASIKLITKNGEYHTDNFYILTNTPKIFETVFTNPVNKESFEKAIKDQLTHNESTDFEWIDDEHVRLKMKDFKDGKYYFSLWNVVDIYGNSLENDKYKFFEFLISPQTELKKPIVYLDDEEINNKEVTQYVDEAHLVFKFNSLLTEDALDKINFYTDNVIVKEKHIKDNTIEIVLDSLSNDPFSLLVESGLEDINNNSLENDFVVNLKKTKKTEKTKADITLIADSGNYPRNTFYYLTDTPKIFEATFTAPMNKDSFETLIKNSLANKANVVFHWINNKKVRMIMKDFEYGKYGFYTDSVIDANGNPLESDQFSLFSYAILPQTTIYSLDLTSNKLNKVDIDYTRDILWDHPNMIVKDKILSFTVTAGISGYDVYSKPLYYDMADRKIIYLDEDIEPTIFYTFEDLIKRGDYYHINGKIYNFDGEIIGVINNNGDVVEKVDGVHKDEGILSFFKYSNSFEQKGISLTIYNNNNNELKNFHLDIGNLEEPYDDSPIDLEYILLKDNRTFIMEGLEQGKEGYLKEDLNLYKLDLNTGELTLLVEKGHSPRYINEREFIYTDSDGRVNIADINGNIIRTLPFKVGDYAQPEEVLPNSKYINVKELEYLNGYIIGISDQLIFLYNINTKEINSYSTPQKLKIIGVGESKIYFANQRLIF